MLCNVVSLLKKGGILILGTVDHSDAALKIGDGAFPVLDIGYFDLSMALSSAGLGHIAINRVEPDRLDRQYQGLLLATSTRL